jgi:Uma2 family endonuclease
MSKREHITDKNKIDSEPFIDYTKEYTYADYVKFEFEEMVELIRGKIFKMSPAPRTIHQSISGNLFSIFHTYLKNKKCRVFYAPFDVILPIKNKKRDKATTVVQPDICIICTPEIIEDTGCFGVPDFIIEIVAGRQVKKDVQDKFSVYEEAGVGEYWIVFADSRCVEVFVLKNGRYKRINTFADDDTIFVHTLPELSISMNDIFDEV